MDIAVNQKRVLICDDSELLVAGLKYTVDKVAGLTFAGQARNGQEAVEMVRTLAPDVVLMDVSMPIMDGIEATRLIKDEFPDARILMLSGSEDPDVARRALLAGAQGYCVKSILGDQLINAIQCVSFGAVWLSPSVSEQLKTSIGCQPTVAAPTRSTAPDLLSPREMDVLQLLVDGLSNQEIADHLFLSTETIKTHVRRIYEKLRVKQRTGAVVEAIRRGLVVAA